MILVVGGRAQGKRAFAEEKLCQEPLCKEAWADGEKADWKKFTESPYAFNLSLFIRRVLLEEESLGLSGEQLKKAKFLLQAPVDFASYLREKCPERILLGEEIGCGIVPMEVFERNYREVTGRVECELAARSEQVWRVCCGLGRRLK